nr:MAG TPA: hypothetical protein [Caudoviricetes sp.]
MGDNPFVKIIILQQKNPLALTKKISATTLL